jgi:CheY-like chemotaxis protein
MKNLSTRILRTADTSMSPLNGDLENPRLMELQQLTADARDISDLAQDLEHLDQEGALSVEPGDVSKLVNDVLERLPRENEEAGLRSDAWVAECEKTEFRARFAAGPLEQVLQSLLLLATRECKPEGKVTVKSRPCHLDHNLEGNEVVPAGDYMLVTLHDGGEGLSEEELDHFFDGMGRKYPDLDLNLSDAMVRHMGGVLDVDTLLGYGTTLSVYLPVDRPYEDPGIPEDPVATVLVVEDKREQHDWLRAYLHTQACKVVFANTGDAALQQLEKYDVDVVLLDLVLAKDTQPRDYVFHQLKKAHPSLPVLVTCGEVDNHVLAEVIQAGAAGFIERPLPVEKLINLIKRETVLAKTEA